MLKTLFRLLIGPIISIGLPMVLLTQFGGIGMISSLVGQGGGTAAMPPSLGQIAPVLAAAMSVQPATAAPSAAVSPEAMARRSARVKTVCRAAIATTRSREFVQTEATVENGRVIVGWLENGAIAIGACRIGDKRVAISWPLNKSEKHRQIDRARFGLTDVAGEPALAVTVRARGGIVTRTFDAGELGLSG